MKITRVFLLALMAASTIAIGDNPKAPPAAARTAIQFIWMDPGAVEKLDFVGGPGGRARAPRPPLTFVEEDAEGSSPKVKVKDATGAVWSVKWGPEVSSDTFASRIAWAAGYIVQPMYFVPKGKIVGVKKLKRAKDLVEPDGSFTNARFQLRDPRMKFLNTRDWTWDENPFVGTHQLNGLKIVMMLTSNWDNKDARDIDRGSNTGILSHRSRSRLLYFVSDWGGSMGKWGGVLGREKWDAEGYAEQTPGFIKEVKDGVVKWGYSGQRTSDNTRNIRVADVKWLLRYVGRITDAQLRAGLAASGAKPSEVALFTPAIRARIDQLRSASR